MISVPSPHLIDPASAQVAAQRGERDQQQEPPIPPAVEKITNPDNEKVLKPKMSIENEPVQKKGNRQKDGKLKRIK